MKVLALSPHPDDIELAAGGTICKLKEEGHDVYIIYFSTCGIAKEMIESVKTFFNGMFQTFNKEKVIPKRHFPEHRQKILDYLIEAREDFKPDLIIGPSPKSIHQDHKIVGEEMIRAFKYFKIISYIHPWNRLSSSSENNCIVELNSKHVGKKIDMLNCYKSQQEKDYFAIEYIIAKLKHDGFYTTEGFAEVFEVIRWSL